MKEQTAPELYSEEELEAIESHIETYFGEYDSVFHELVSPDIHVDICLIEPSPERNYYTLVTMGMGAHPMNVPAELAQYKLERAEMVITLPADWQVAAQEEIWYWPLRLLKSLARLPIHNHTWLGWGHTVDNGEPYGENTQLCAALLLSPQVGGEGASVCQLPNGEEVNFYQVIPLYRREMELKCRHNAETLLEYLGEVSHVVDICRPDAAAGVAMEKAEAEDTEDAEAEIPVIPAGEKKASLLSEADIAQLESFSDETSGYFGKLIDYLEDFMEQGVAEERFTLAEARADLQIALWYAYGCNNMDSYEYYYAVTQWMPYSEANACGCGKWYYRYVYALIYCGRLKEALAYGERGVKEDPDYPWGWLLVGKLRSHFGDKEGALEAVAQGLALEPEDYEFMVLEQEIKAGKTLEEMMYHYIDPACDLELQNQSLLSEGKEEKLQSVAGIVCEEQGLAAVKELFQPGDWQKDAPYCSFHTAAGEQVIEVVFHMNEAALSKMDLAWLSLQQERFFSRDYLMRQIRGEACLLDKVSIYRDKTIAFYYPSPDGNAIYRLHLDERGEVILPPAREGDGAQKKPRAKEKNRNGMATVITLYHPEPIGLCYAQCWRDDANMVVHTGKVGEAGRTEKTPYQSLAEYEAYLKQFYEEYQSRGYAPWEEAMMTWLAVELPLPQETSSREAWQAQVERRLGEGLNWTGVGMVESLERGEESLIVHCLTVDETIGVAVARQILEGADGEIEIDSSRLKIAAMPFHKEAYTLVYDALDR